MHASMVLSKEILSAEVIVGFGRWLLGIWIAGTCVTAIEFKLEMLRRDVAFPLVLGAEG